ncbi:MAG: AsmA-like C-terminal region-containing protein [Planctomycetes bacterium]|nr:AsmA-like C-terminal region-containing protein [Planctomycetota bacterium]
MLERNHFINRLRDHGHYFWIRRRGISSAIVLLAILMWLSLRFTPALNWIIGIVVTSESGVDTEVTNAQWNGWGNLTVEKVVLRVPKWPGRAAEMVSIEGIDVTVNPTRLLLGQIFVSELHIASAAINIAERQNAHGIFNLMALQPKSGPGGSPIRLQQAKLDRLDIVSLTVAPSGAVVLEGQHAFTGLVKPKGVSRRDFEFELTELPAPDPKPDQTTSNLVLKGSWNEETFAYRMAVTGLSFNESLLPMLPYQFHEIWKLIDLKGSIDRIEIVGQPNRLIDEATLTVRNVEANILFPGYKREWVRYEPAQISIASPGAAPAPEAAPKPGLRTGLPRMKVDQGTVKFAQNKLSFEDFKGTLHSTRERSLPLPMELDLEIALPSEDQPTDLAAAAAWLEDAIARSGIQARLQIPHFAMTGDSLQQYDGVELPSPAVQVLTNLQARTWDIDLDVTASRPIAPRDPSGTVEAKGLSTKGTLKLTHGSGGYFLFPYMMTDVSATIELNNEVVTIVTLDGKGSGNSLIHIDGTVTEPGDDAGVDLNIKADDVPIDDALKNSFLYGIKKVFALLYDQAAHESLCAAGLLKPGEYEFGGRCGVDLKVQRAVKGGSIVRTTGTIKVRDANVVCSRFPYPVHVASGEIQVEDELITLPVGKWKLTTPTMAKVSFDGVVRIPRSGDERRVFPDLHVAFDKDHVTPLLLAAIPFETPNTTASPPAGWPGTNLSSPARMLRQIGLQGNLSGHGVIGADPDERTTWDFDIMLENGTITPRPAEAGAAPDADQILPNGFNLDRVKAQARLTDQNATLVSLNGSIGEGKVDARGFASLKPKQRWFQATAHQVPIDRWLFGFLPAEKADQALLTWGGCHPTGTIDADVHLVIQEGKPDRRHVVIDPTNVRFAMDGNDAMIKIPCGYLELIDEALHVHDVRMDFIDRLSPMAMIDEAMNARDLTMEDAEQDAPVGHLEASGCASFGKSPRLEANRVLIEAHMDSVEPVFFRILPIDVRERLERIQFRSDGPFDLTNGVFQGPAPDSGIVFSADMRINEGQLNSGVWLKNIHGQLRLRNDDSGPINGAEIDVVNASLTIRDRPITGIHGSLVNHFSNDDFLIPSLEGDFYGGRIWLDAVARGKGTRPWQVNLGVAGSDLPELIAGHAPSKPIHSSDGRVNANISLGGELNGDRPREGRGKIRGYDARLGDLPLAIRLLQVTQLMPPLSESLKEAKIDFYLRGHKVRFEKFDLTCPTLQLLGSGSLDLDAWTISMRFKNRGIIPVASDVLGAATDLFLAIDVEGPVSDPRITAKALPGIGNDPSAEQPDLAPTSSNRTASP